MSILAAPRLVALEKRGQDADDAVGRGADIDDRRAGAQRPPRRSRHEGKPAHHLRQLVERRPVLVRPGQETLDRHDDEARIGRLQRIEAEPEPVHRAGCVIVEAHIGRAHELEEDRLALRRLEVDRDAALVAVEVVVARPRARHAPRLVAAVRVLDLDHVGAEIGEDERRRRPGDDVPQLENAQARERQWCGCRISHGVRACGSDPAASSRALDLARRRTICCTHRAVGRGAAEFYGTKPIPARPARRGAQRRGNRLLDMNSAERTQSRSGAGRGATRLQFCRTNPIRARRRIGPPRQAA